MITAVSPAALNWAGATAAIPGCERSFGSSESTAARSDADPAGMLAAMTSGPLNPGPNPFGQDVVGLAGGEFGRVVAGVAERRGACENSGMASTTSTTRAAVPAYPGPALHGAAPAAPEPPSVRREPA